MVGSLSDQRTNQSRRPVIVLSLLFLLVVGCLVAMYVVGDLTKFQAAVSEKESRTALRDVADPEQLDRALKRYPSNQFLQMIALARDDANDIDAASQTALREAEPKALPKLGDLGGSSLNDLEALRRDLKTADVNAATSSARYAALIKTKRDKMEEHIRSLKAGDDQASSFMAMIDEQHAAWMELTSKILAARADYDSAYEKCVSLLVRDFGIYTVTNGQFVFPFQSSANGFNNAAAAMAAAAKRSSEIDDERMKLKQSRLGRWKAFVER
jgi:predicted aminopeptidase